ncbi:uncharacterized protein B0H64DRAFT_400259 [Chaetomium fimeti]|uniref:Uncharacterized protein n=1 Tax=Chaetomium fimeti TaxID=1854472 RepID=A0AAE0HCV9_9PEZI|nr:hypothetical protein B0H64DRAFT_400259 [Chaetomium fimeti]
MVVVVLLLAWLWVGLWVIGWRWLWWWWWWWVGVRRICCGLLSGGGGIQWSICGEWLGLLLLVEEVLCEGRQESFQQCCVPHAVVSLGTQLTQRPPA